MLTRYIYNKSLSRDTPNNNKKIEHALLLSIRSLGNYLSGSGGFGGGLESLKIDSELCELRTRLVVAAVCSKICLSLGVSGISGKEFLCGVNSDP